MDLRRRQAECDKADFKAEARQRGYYYHYRMKDPENFVLVIYAVSTDQIVREVPFTATMEEYPYTQAHLTARRAIPALPDLTVAPAPKPNPLDLTGAVQLALV